MSDRIYTKNLFYDDLKAWADEIEENQLSYDEFMQQYLERYPYQPVFWHRNIECELCKQTFNRKLNSYQTYQRLKYKTYGVCWRCKKRKKSGTSAEGKKDDKRNGEQT